ncbi:oxidoreductase [Candidatus Saganbacteria bacterium CG08_land_8_20_14_0_20_45_16]|uniref:Oxidoreductase n=1 Tax=Candidatus Saganbacteria bacterium CG08_land_8_20_14_0_20_45_16 TaxID=2014293 RepID=A0A2H0Y1N4_UNCSA|nr:MAG: oxidoreductase [Candidatus Saganbacteria bacterium CG08_land_8_20_14_0_20_45_16]
MKKPRGLKVAVIGVGSIGKHHARILAHMPGVSLTAIVDPNETAAKEVASLYNAPHFTSHDSHLTEFDVAIIATPTQTHCGIAKQLLEAGKHLLVEKPLTKTSAEARELVDLARAKGLILTTGHIERFNPAYQGLKKLIKGEKIIGLTAQRFSPFPARITDADAVEDMMIHDLDLVLDLLPTDEIESLRAKGEKIKTKTWDKVSASLFFKSGIVAKVSVDRVYNDKVRKLIVTTDKGLIEADLLNKQVYIRNLQYPQPSIHHTKQCDQLTEELQAFIKSVKKGTPLVVTGEAGYKAIKLAQEVQKACS